MCYTSILSHTHTRLTAFCPGLPGWARTRKVKPIWILLKQERVSGSGISWAICKCASRSRQITLPGPHHSVFYRPDALPATQPTASKHWRQSFCHTVELVIAVLTAQGRIADAVCRIALTWPCVNMWCSVEYNVNCVEYVNCLLPLSK